MHPTNPTAIKVKRDGPRGWHWISAASFDPAVHEIVGDELPPVSSEARTAKPRRKKDAA